MAYVYKLWHMLFRWHCVQLSPLSVAKKGKHMYRYNRLHACAPPIRPCGNLRKTLAPYEDDLPKIENICEYM